MGNNISYSKVSFLNNVKLLSDIPNQEKNQEKEEFIQKYLTIPVYRKGEEELNKAISKLKEIIESEAKKGEKSKIIYSSSFKHFENLRGNSYQNNCFHEYNKYLHHNLNILINEFCLETGMKFCKSYSYANHCNKNIHLYISNTNNSFHISISWA